MKWHWRAMALSVLLHAAIVAAAVYGWMLWPHKKPEPTPIAIEATVVDASQVKGLEPAPKPEPTPPPPVEVPPPDSAPAPEPVDEQGPPKPDPAELERKQEEERLAAEKAEQEKQDELKRDQEKQQQEQKAHEAADRREAQKQAAAKAAVEKAAAEKKAAEKKRVDDAAAAKKAADEKARQAREAELRRSLEAEERGNALRNSDQMRQWQATIAARIARAWIKPPSAQPGVECIVHVTQVPGGEVVDVKVDECRPDDPALRESVKAAVLRASPLPPPPDPALFDRNLEIQFAPDK